MRPARDAVIRQRAQQAYDFAVAAYVKAVLRERAKRGVLEPRHRTVLTGVPS